MNSRERLLGAINREPIDRVPMMEYYWGSTIDNWKKQGLEERIGKQLVQDDFQSVFDFFQQDQMNMACLDWSFQYEPCVIEETDEYIISRSKDNVKSKTFKESASMLEMSDYSVVDRETWEAEKPRLRFNESRIDIEEYRKLQDETKDTQLQVYFPACLGFEKFKYCSGTENLLLMIGEEPELVRDMVEATERLAFDGLEYCLGKGVTFDVGYITEDMGFSNGPFFSPAFYREIIMPSHKRWNDFLHAHGMKSMLHTCGDVRLLMKDFVEAGFDILNPLEQKAGMDLIAVKRDFGERLTLWGGIDVKTISFGDERQLHDEIREKVLFAKQGYGYVFGSDHSIPDNVPLSTYEKMLEWGMKYGQY